jgi:hypothetical protein
LWIRIGINADPEPDFYLTADPDPGQTLPSQKVEFLQAYLPTVCTEGKKAF